MRSALLAAGFLTLALSPTQAQDAAGSPAPATGKARVLFVTHSAGFVHPVVRRVEKGKRALAEKTLTEIAGDHFEVECTQDASELTAERLAQFACVVFYTTGKLPIPEPQALIDYVRAGGGFVGVHSATDTFYEFAPYGEMIGGYFDGHPWHQEVELVVENEKHPITAHLGDRFRITDEIYQHRSWSRDGKNVLLHLDGSLADLGRGKREDRDYGLAWCNEFGEGRVFYNALGHRHEVWADPRFQRMMISGIRWAMGGETSFAARPAGAIALFDGENTDNLVGKDGSACGWKVVDGALEIVPGKGSVVSRGAWQDFVLHVGFQVVAEPDREPGLRGNSGVYLQQRYELQILDSSEGDARIDGCGAIYRQRPADVNAARPAGAWQDYWIAFQGARFDDAGEKTANARISVVHNGILTHDDVELTAKTGAGQPEGPEALPLLLQDHGSVARFRDVWVLPR
jgi:type 1 glutamine amidotransferase